MKITTIGIDLAKNVLQLHGINAHGKVVLRRQIVPSKVLGRVDIPKRNFSIVAAKAC